MAVGLKPPEGLRPIVGIRLGTACAGIRRPDHPDVTVVEIASGASVAAVFTRNQFCAAPVLVARRHLAQGTPRALLINTGYANAGTGPDGERDAEAVCATLARTLGCATHEVLPFSTGIIGGRLPVEKINTALATAHASAAQDRWHDAARAIMTTDTVAKAVSRRVVMDGRTVTLTGMAKGSGMIEPHMATLLSFIATDAVIGDELLRRLLTEAVDASFNRVTIDGDTSTNDACVLVATGASGVSVHPQAAGFPAFRQALHAVFVDLAQAIIRDGEGATKFVTVEVRGARDDQEAANVAYGIARSPLVKTALFAKDANWGRIIAAAGRSVRAPLDARRVTLAINGVVILSGGAPDPKYREEDGARAMQADEIHIRLDLGAGEAHTEVWTCDLSYEYVRINGDYRS